MLTLEHKETIISDADLVTCLENIKSEIQNIEFLYNGQVVFLNLDSFYNYINDLTFITNGKDSSLKHLIKIVEPYIPMAVSENHLEMFLNAAMNSNGEMLDDIENYFDKITKINFINSIFKAQTEDSWNDILIVCRTLRDFKEGEIKNIYKGLRGNSSFFSI